MDLHLLAGNQSLKEQLRTPHNLAHAIIISGEPGSGRHTLAKLLAQAMVCTGLGEKPCGVCNPCKKVEEGIHPDVMKIANFMAAEDVGKEIKVGAVRALREDAQIRPNEADCKVYIIDGSINVQAQNAMLKLLEDGPAYAVFFLITENADALLETVRSRCGEVHLNRVTQQQALSYLVSHYPDRDRDEVTAAAQQCEGLIGRAVAELEGNAPPEEALELLPPWVKALTAKSELMLMECAATAEQQKWKRDTLPVFYAGIEQLFHQALVCALTGAEPDGEAAALAQTLSPRQLAAGERLAEEARRSCAYNPGMGHSLGSFTVKLWRVLAEG